ncbi:TonB-dependent receptor [Qipengyuania qiaonensis]|uniref:TonB-dependent receptor n=1 Tax=Qipengyuania qiaonensis TaxID=2867240 RepID=A0ABS7J3P1_9SPHN|nr:TonB-dependent receptor [Qipengyuania qiaonensis]MBX7481943.1 TonB-dependent receptor [Qipengyuania qiaonensis]
MRHAPYALVALAASLPAQAEARDRSLDISPGTVAESAIAIARQTGTSIVVSDPAIARRRAPRIRGRMSASEAVRRLADSVGARAIAIDNSSWRLEPQLRRTARSARAAGTPASQPRPAASQPPPPAPAAEIVVVASKRDTTLEDLPAQVSIVDGKELALGGIGGTEKITQRIATVSSTYLGSGRNKLFIRGIADSSFTGPTQATVGQYLDDMRLSYNAPDPDLRLSDLERVEVLEGPQGTLYGAGSLGGIIRLVPNSPELDRQEFRASAGGALTQHGAGSADASATANVPLAAERAALRITLDAVSEGGYIDKPVLGSENVNRTRILAGRAIARLELAPQWTLDAIGLAQSTHASDSQYAAREGDRYESAAQVREGSDADYLHGQLVLAGRIGPLKLRSTTGIARQELEERYDATMPDAEDRIFIQRNDTRMLTHETRVWLPLDERRFGWLAGVSLIDNRTQLNRSLERGRERSAATGVLNTITEATLYGEGSYRLRDNLIATVGARLTYARLGGSAEDVPLALTIERAAVTASRDQSAILPSASLLASLSPVTSLYARYQEGFRPGGLAIEGEFVRRFCEDHARTLEFGARHGRAGIDTFDLALNLSYTRWSDIQADFIDDLGLPSTANIGDGRVWTISASGGAFLTDDLRLTGGATLNRSRIDEPVTLSFSRITHVPNIAEFSGRLGLEYSRHLGSGLDLDGRVWASYIGKSRLGIGPELGDLQGDYLDSGLLVRVSNDRIGGTLSITNLADSEGNRFALGTPFAVVREQVTPLRPRTIRIGVDFTF